MGTTDPMKQAWHDVAESVATLGRLMKERYQDADDSDEAEALRGAVDRLKEAGREVGDRVSDVARDDHVKAHAKRTATSLDEALTATVDLISEQLGTLVKRRPSGAADDPPADAPSSDQGDTGA